mmetsp:Transcript_38741/g.93656  ORF Transcript_38741/g.93656 Transcript_38741/m.93656 type:complete len:103 (+) Transcript_38741:137-445(+)
MENGKSTKLISCSHNFWKKRNLHHTLQEKQPKQPKTMSLLRYYDPFTSMFDDAFDHTPFFRNEQSLMSCGGCWQPSGMTSHEDDKTYVFQVDLPGVKADDLK